MSETIGIALVCLFCVSMGFMLGYVFGAGMARNKYYTEAELRHAQETRAMGYVNKNDNAKNSARMGAVPEFIAPGELAEVVEKIENTSELGCRAGEHLMRPETLAARREKQSQDKCHGCRYAGRYLVPSHATR